MAGQDFNITDPKKDVTDPDGHGARTEYPRVLYRLIADGADLPDTTIVVSWQKKRAIHNDVITVRSLDEQAAMMDEGWSLAPITEEPIVSKPVKGAKAAA